MKKYFLILHIIALQFFTASYLKSMNSSMQNSCPISSIADLALRINEKDLNKISKTGHELQRINRIIKHHGEYLICNNQEYQLLLQDLDIIKDAMLNERKKVLETVTHKHDFQLHIIVAEMQIGQIQNILEEFKKKALNLSANKFASILLDVSDYYAPEKFFGLQYFLSFIETLELTTPECKYITSILNYIKTKHEDKLVQSR